MPVIADVQPAQIEQVEREMQTLFEESDQIAAKVKKSAKVKTISRFLYRIPVMKWRGGATRKVNMDGGSLGTGTGMKLDSLLAGYIATVRAYKVTREQENTSASKQQSTIDVLATTVAHAVEDAGIDDDIAFHQDGSGILTAASSAQTTTTLTFATAGDNLGVNLLREGMAIDVWKSDLSACLTTTLRPLTITNIDYVNKIITVDQTVTGMNLQTNVVTIESLESYGPAAPATTQSTWPDKTSAGGIGGDSYRHGFPYINNVDSSDYYLGKQRSAFLQLMPAVVNASSGAITFDHGQLAIDQLIQRRNVTSGNHLQGIFHMAQRAAVQRLGVTINNVFIDSGKVDGGKSKDLLPTNHGYTDTFQYCGIPCMLSKRQDKSRADFLDFSKLFRTEVHPLRFFTDGNGQKFFQARDTNGAVTAASEFFVESCYDFGSLDPGTGAVIHSAAVPTGW